MLLGYEFTIPSGLVPFHPAGLWFVPVYVLLYLISPILNQLITSKYIHKSAIVLLLTFSLLAYFGGGYQGYSILNFILLYLIGRWLKLYPIEVTMKKILVILVTSVVFTFIANVIAVNCGMAISSKFFWAYCSPWIILSSVSLLLIFSKIELHYSKFITFLASGSFSVYLLHENSLINGMIYGRPLRYIESVVTCDIAFVFIAIGYAFALFLMIATFDVLRRAFQDLFFKICEKINVYNRLSEEITKVFK